MAAVAFSYGIVTAADLSAIKAEPNLEKRSEKALANANHAIDVARDSYAAGDVKRAREALDELAESVDLSHESLAETHKHPRSSPKYFKKAEVSIREMQRRLKSLEDQFSVNDRPMLQEAAQKLQQVRDDLVDGIMSKKKR